MKLLFYLGSLLLPQLLAAQEFDLHWFGLSGYGESAGGVFALSASIGQNAGVAEGGDFALTEGFWSITSTVETPEAPTLSLRLEGAELILSWPQRSGAAFQLEVSETSPVSPGAEWKQVGLAPFSNGSETTVRVPVATGRRFYRLHHP
jgi:hypothetical protein